jgi:glycosyltransferase involved in cell wall biosynthesis
MTSNRHSGSSESGQSRRLATPVTILLSTYNGEQYLSAQLDSLLNQRDANLSIEVRDDASTDATRDIVAQYAAEHPQIRYRYGLRLGAAGSFFDLLKHADLTSSYFAFCDQDDVWYPDKVALAIDNLEAVGDVPALFCSRLEYVDENLNRIGYSRLPHRPVGFENALAENIAVGCTLVLNQPARTMVLESLPATCIMHDWWCYLVIAAFGVVVYHERPTVKYRLHGGNQIGAPASAFDDLSRRIRRFYASGRDAFKIHAQAQTFKTAYRWRLDENRTRVLDRFLASRTSLRTRIGYALHKDIYRQSWLDDLVLRSLIVGDRY